ncbi:MAG: hypothetical protein OEZ31_01455 [Nitrospirota bacterium]|nr:hypothetical protein [Nitrospirota bacterium]MDH5767612.1 hypothetical protein [Nitrospirota bacterium]
MKKVLAILLSLVLVVAFSFTVGCQKAEPPKPAPKPAEAPPAPKAPEKAPEATKAPEKAPEAPKAPEKPKK